MAVQIRLGAFWCFVTRAAEHASRTQVKRGIDCNEGLWRNGSASDSRSDGWAFESLWPHFRVTALLFSPQKTEIQHPRIELGTFRVLGGRHHH